jgi:hypothetical protein
MDGMQEGKQIVVQIKWSGTLYPIEWADSETVLQLKEKIALATEVQPHRYFAIPGLLLPCEVLKRLGMEPVFCWHVNAGKSF